MTTHAPTASACVGDAERLAYRRFIDACRSPDGNYMLTPHADASTFALCFAIFGLNLLREHATIDAHREHWDMSLRAGLLRFRAVRETAGPLNRDKPYLQLLTFTLSALTIMGTLDRDPMRDLVLPMLPTDIEAELHACGVLQGHARSGNHAMFLGILMLHARDHLGLDTGAAIERWVDIHLSGMNRFGFWGEADSMSHLQFQNGYHQYELLEYLQTEGVPWDLAAAAVATLADAEGHFAPWPGGGGCYDYDAVFMLTCTDACARCHAALLERTAASLLAEQNPDGGFCESTRIRPRSPENLLRSVKHVRAATGRARTERLRQAITLFRPYHDRIRTHWSSYSRGWGESDLWDSWFRMLTLARIECALDPRRATEWGFIDYPGIGYHPSLHGARA